MTITAGTDSDDHAAKANDARSTENNHNNNNKKDTCYECDTEVLPTSSVELHPCGHSLCLHCMIEQQALTKNEPSFLCPCGKHVTSHRHVRLSKQLLHPKRHRSEAGIVQETVVTFDYASDDEGEDGEGDDDEEEEEDDDDDEAKEVDDSSNDEEEDEAKQEEDDHVEHEEISSTVRGRDDHHITAASKTSRSNDDEPPTKRVAILLKTTTELLEEYKHWSSEPAGLRGAHPVYDYLEHMQNESEKGWLRREEAR